MAKHQFALTGPFWDSISSLKDSIGNLGFAVVGIFVACWIGSVAVSRWRGYDRLETAKLG
jgi:high-affinity nickel-transport protein